LDFAEKHRISQTLDRVPHNVASAPTLHLPQPDDGPVTITFDFHVDAVNRARFIDLMREVRLMYLRNSAFSWRLDEDLSECHVFRVEMLVASWSKHLLQHERITKEEHRNLERAWSLDLRPDGSCCKAFYFCR
jgi:Transmembrane secretion effector